MSGNRYKRTPAVLVLVALLLATCIGCRSLPADTPIDKTTPSPTVGLANELEEGLSEATLAQLLSRLSLPAAGDLVSAKAIPFEHITTREGLPSSSVYWITQDHLGFLWVGTSGGLARYDGHSFRVYQHDPDDAHSLSDDHVFHVLEDHEGELWVATYGGGLERLDRDKDRFIHYRFDPADDHSLSHDKVYGLYEDRANTLWVATSGGGLNRYDPEIDGFVHYRHDPLDPDSLIDDYVNTIYEDEAGILWLGTTKGLEKFDRETGRFVHYRHDPQDPDSLSNDQVFAILQDHLGILWVGTSGGGLNRFIPETSKFAHYRHDPQDDNSLSDDVIFFLLEDVSGTLWAASLGGGLNRFDRETETFVHYRADPQDPASLSSDSVNTLFEDREGTLWIGTTHALDKYARQKLKFDRFLDTDIQFVQTILQDSHRPGSGTPRGQVWIGTTEGLHRLDSSLEEVAFYGHDPDDADSLGRGWVTDLYEGRDGGLWVGTSGGGLNRFDESTGRFVHYLHDPQDADSLSNDFVNAIYQDEAGTFWIGTDGGLNRFDPLAGTFRLVPTDPDHPEAARVESIDLIAAGDEGRIWIGGWGDGVKRFDPQTGRFTAYRHDSNDTRSLKTNFVTSLYHDSAGNLWVGTDRGLHRFEPETEGFHHYGPDEGLQVEKIGELTEDGHGNLWIGATGTLVKRDAETGTFAHHSIQEGVRGGSFAAAACRLVSPREGVAGDGGLMLFGGADGVVVFDPDELWSNPYVPPVQFVALRQIPQDEPVALQQALENTRQVSLSWPNRDFEFEFAALSYVQPESNQHAYMLEGYDQAWNLVGSNRSGRYTNLPGGTYTLRIKGSNNDGLWNETGTALAISIVPPIWETWWFRGLVGLVVVAGAVSAYRLRVRNIEARTRELEKQVSARTRELATLNVVAQTTSRSLDLEAMLAATLDKVLEVLGFESGAILLHDPDRDELQLACQRGFSPDLRGEIAGFYAQAAGPPGNRPILIDDTSREPNVPQQVLDEGYQAVASIPLASRGQVQGVLVAAGRQVRRFLKQDVDLLLSIGHQIGVAVENARLYEGTRDRLAQLGALQETSTAVASVLELDELLNLITEQATTLLKADGGMLNLVDWEQDEDYVVAACGSTAWTVGIRSSLRSSLSGWASLHNQPVISNDVRADSRVDQAGRAHLEDRNQRTVANAAVAPLTIKGQVVGTLALLDKQQGAADFFQDDLDLLVAFANQAATAIENARLFRAEQRRAEQFRVISEVGRRIASLLDIDEILAHVTSLVQETFGYDHVGIALVENGYAEYKAGAGEMWDRGHFEFKPNRLKVGEEGITGWVAGQGEARLVPDVSQDPNYIWMEGSRTRSELALPIKVKDEVVGVLDVQSNERNAFDESDVAVLQALADQTAVAIKNAQLFRAEQRRAEQFRVISEVGRRVTSILAIDELLTQMATLIREAFDYYHVGLGLIEGEEVVSKAEVGALAQAYHDTRLKVGQQGVWGQVAASGQPAIVPDVRREPIFHATHGTEAVRSHICVPLRTKEAVIGVLSAASDQLNAFDDSDLVVLQSLADQAAIAVENIHLYEQAQQLAVIEERGRLARDLHDAVTQTLFSSSLIAEALPDLWENDPAEGRQLLAELQQLSRGALAEMRTLLLELRPTALVEADLRHLLRQLGEATAGRTGLPVVVEAEDPCPLPDDVHVTLYRIAQEALNNTVKHARANRVEVCLRCLDGRAGVELSVVDDGRGFDPTQIAPERLGLGILRERAQAIGAELEIGSRPGEGTRIRVVWRGVMRR